MLIDWLVMTVSTQHERVENRDIDALCLAAAERKVELLLIVAIVFG